MRVVFFQSNYFVGVAELKEISVGNKQLSLIQNTTLFLLSFVYEVSKESERQPKEEKILFNGILFLCWLASFSRDSHSII